MHEIHSLIKSFYDEKNDWYRCRLDQNTNGSQATLESVVGRYLIYCYMTKEYGNVEHILETLEFFGGILPRVIIRDGRTAQELDALERKKGLWVNDNDSEGKPCAVRMDSGTGQAPIACMGLYLMGGNLLGSEWAERIARNKYQIRYDGETVPQGDMLAYWPLPMNGMLEVLALSEMSTINVPFMQRPRIALSLSKMMPWDNPIHRSLLLWFLQSVNKKYKKLFDSFIRTRDCDLSELERKYNEVEDDIKHQDYLTSTLNYLIALEIRI